jgi:hypothetical protein
MVKSIAILRIGAKSCTNPNMGKRALIRVPFSSWLLTARYIIILTHKRRKAMHKSIYLIELRIYLILGLVVGGLITGVGMIIILISPDASWKETLLLILGLFLGFLVLLATCYIGYLISIAILSRSSSKGEMYRINLVIMIVVGSGGAGVVFLPLGEIVRRIALRSYKGEPVETLFGTHPKEIVSTTE